MPHLHCSSCHHEFEVSTTFVDRPCDWCNAPAPHVVLERRTPLEKLLSGRGLKKYVDRGLKRYIDRMVDRIKPT